MDSALKQRLLGAAVLIALLIIFVPMFLGSSPPKEASAIQNVDFPPEPERKFETRTLPVESSKPAIPAAPKPSTDDKVATVDTKASASFEAPDAKAPDKAPTASATTAPAAPAASETKTAADAAKPAVVDATPAPTSPGGRFSVNLASMPTRATPMRSSQSSRRPGLPHTAKQRNTKASPPSACVSVPMRIARLQSRRA